MSFRARLTSFFVLIVVIPMTAMGLLVFKLIDHSAQSQSQSRAAGIAASAATAYHSSSQAAELRAHALAVRLGRVPATDLPERVSAAARPATGVVRISVRLGTRGRVISAGDPSAVAPGIAVVRGSAGRPSRTVTVSELTAARFAASLAGAHTIIVVRQGDRTLGASDPVAARISLPAGGGRVTVDGADYRTVSERVPGFTGAPATIIVLSQAAAVSAAAGEDRILAGACILGFLILALGFTLLASRGLQAQVSRFLDAARRLGGGDFSVPVQTVGHDAFAALGDEFNAMSRQLRDRLDQLEEARSRFRDSVRRIGEAFASGLDRDALLQIALRTAIDATEADRGRITARREPGGPLLEAGHVGRLAGVQAAFGQAERAALDGQLGEAASGEVHVAAVRLGAISGSQSSHGVIAVSRDGRRFSADDFELLRSLAARATLALANATMHDDVARQAVTDDLTELASHGHFQERLRQELAESTRYGQPLAVAMFDIDNFKSFNDTHGHQQGDVVLRRVADALRDCCREADLAARYGGEELALVLPHTDLEGAHELAERIRGAIEQMAIPRLDHQGWLKVTTSVGVAATRDGDAEALVAAADGALYAAKRSGKNRTVRAPSGPDAAPDARELASVPGSARGE